MPVEDWLPEIIHRRPGHLKLRYRSGGRICPGTQLAERMRESLHAAGLEWQRSDDGSWMVTLHWQTLVLGVLRRRVNERVVVRIVSGPEGEEISVTCRPDRTHDAHAAGMSCMIVLAFLAGLIGGWSPTGVSASLGTLLVGGLLADYSRRAALTVLKRRLKRLAEDLGLALWPRR